LEHYFLPGDLEKQIEVFVDYYNHQRYHESLNNLTPADVYFGRGESILRNRQRIKRNTLAERRFHLTQRAVHNANDVLQGCFVCLKTDRVLGS